MLNVKGLTNQALRRLIWRAKVQGAIEAAYEVTHVHGDRVRCGDVAGHVERTLDVANSWRHRRECRQAVADLGCRRVVRAAGIRYYVGMRAK